MKAIWKILLGTAAVAAVTPYSVKKDEETGKVVVTSATWKATYTKNGDDKHVELKLLPALQKDEECCCEDETCDCQDECCCDEAPEETDDGITIDVTVEEPAEPEEPAEAEEPKPQEE